ncbi:hypothetical protein A0H81_13772 [Grifola frondosa]|uniref:Uncharacterized protein n=1 Tax=Grifola frondosa TaxID=5627 RepID=A0A1C7LTN5_GRIFR|nr:hypothetical protein A0H81_13772 [Grifola frondosa]
MCPSSYAHASARIRRCKLQHVRKLPYHARSSQRHSHNLIDKSRDRVAAASLLIVRPSNPSTAQCPRCRRRSLKCSGAWILYYLVGAPASGFVMKTAVTARGLFANNHVCVALSTLALSKRDQSHAAALRAKAGGGDDGVLNDIVLEQDPDDEMKTVGVSRAAADKISVMRFRHLTEGCDDITTTWILAAKGTDFETWREGAGILDGGIPSNEAKTLYNQLRVFKVPKWSTNLPESEDWENESIFLQALKSLPTEAEDDPNMYQIEHFLHVLSLAFVRYYNSALANEASQRRGLDDIVELAFGRKKDEFEVHIEARMRIPRSTALCANRLGANAVVDTLITFPAPALHVDRFKGAGVSPQTAYHTQWYPGPNNYKKTNQTSNSNQVIMDFGTAQSQRRALGLKDRVIFGIAGAAGRVTVLSSWWNGDKINFIEHERWDLSRPLKFIEFYMFLCNLAAYMRHSMQAELDEYDITKGAATVQDHLWRALEPPTRPPKAGSKRSRPSNDDAHGGDSSSSADLPKDDLEPKELDNWKVAREAWKADRKRAWEGASNSGDSVLSRENLRKHLKLLVTSTNWEKDLRDSVDDWRSSVSGLST